MFAPVRSLLAVRPLSSPALLVAAASIALHFAATPFLIPSIVTDYDVSLGSAGLISVFQVGGFTLANLFAGRRLRPGRRILVGAATIGAAANMASALVGAFGALLALRATAGLAAGLITWLAWAEAMRRPAALKDVAAVGPLTALIGSPVLAWVISVGDSRAGFLLIAFSCLPAAFMPTSFGEQRLAARRRMSPSRSNIVLLAALGLMTGAGSSLFVFAGAIGEKAVGLDPVAVSLAFSVNAGAGLVAARRTQLTTKPWFWLLAIAGCVGSVALVSNAAVFYLALALWGYSFWRAVPVVLTRVAEWSLVPEERTGDAQAIMAFGRMLGPLGGGALIALGDFTVLGIVAGSIVALSAWLVWGVGRYRVDNPDRRPIAA